MRALLINKATNTIENTVELAEDGYTETYIKHEDGSIFPTTSVNGETILTSKYLVPANYKIVFSDIDGQVGEVYPKPAIVTE